jgi:hypothetical protein
MIQTRGGLSQKGPFLILYFDSSSLPGQAGYCLVSKLISKSKLQNLTYVMSFDTIVVYETNHCP